MAGLSEAIMSVTKSEKLPLYIGNLTLWFIVYAIDPVNKTKKLNISKFFLRIMDLYISVNVILSSSLDFKLSESD